jgi:spoIIIJ-associated protein
MNHKNSVLFEGETLEIAYKKATLEYKCSLAELKSEVVQLPNSGFLGLFKKDAIIKICDTLMEDKHLSIDNKNDFKIKDINKDINSDENGNTDKIKDINNDQNNHKKENIFDNFYEDLSTSQNIILPNINDTILIEIKKDINNLFSKLQFEIEEIQISFYDKETIYIKFDGKDVALLIGKEGNRYKAISYILFNWIQPKYNYMIRLEIAEFLKEQERNIYEYIEELRPTINNKKLCKTKILDGILIHIALKKLREEFPNKYIAVKITARSQKYILINEYKK